MRIITFATYSAHPEILSDDMHLCTALSSLGFEVNAAVWNDSSVRWEQSDLVLIRSTWDYYKKSEEFFLWLDNLERLSIPVWNDIPLMRWNADKRYLRDLEREGIVIVPTYWVERHNPISLQTILQQTGWEIYIIKPTISAGAYYTITGNTTQTLNHEHHLQEILQFSDVMIQPLIPSIQEIGEYSLIFFFTPNGIQFSHSVLKTPKAGEFRVQEEFGGTTVYVQPDKDFLMQAHNIVEQVFSIHGHHWLYARVDGVLHQGRFHLMELEMIEPCLFFSQYPAAAERLATIIAQYLDIK